MDKQDSSAHESSNGSADVQTSKRLGSTPTSKPEPLHVARGRVRTVISSIAIALFFIFGRKYILPTQWPTTYALCTKGGANIYTVDAKQPRVECLIVHNQRFVDLGSLREIMDRWKRAADPASENGNYLPVRYVKRGAIVVPGLSDSHVHLLEYGAMRQLPLEGAQSPAAVARLVYKYVESKSKRSNHTDGWIEGWGWDDTYWPEGTRPHLSYLDAEPLLRNQSIVLTSKDGHAMWVNSHVLNLLGELPEEVDGGIIVRDDSGEPTGVLVDNAQDFVHRVKPLPTHDTLLERFQLTVNDALGFGITSLHDAALTPTSLDFFKGLSEQQQLPIRLYGMQFFDETDENWGASAMKILGSPNNGARLVARSVKIFADGALRTSGAALYEPYTDDPTTSGFLRIEPEKLAEVIPRFLKDGWQVNVHAIGDRTHGVVLDIFENALRELDVDKLRPRLEHAQLMRQDDIHRLGRMGVISSVQPTHAISDMWYAEDRLGPERVKGLYAFRSIIDAGGQVTLGTDCPVESMNPLSTFYAAVTRLSPEGKSPHGPDGWFPEQRLTRAEALKGLTLDPAYASFAEESLGSITIGKRADYAVLSQDIMEVPVDEILSTQVLATVLDGSPVYGRI